MHASSVMSSFFGTHDCSLLEKNTWSGCHSPFQGISPMQGLVFYISHTGRQILYHCINWEVLSIGDEVLKNSHGFSVFPTSFPWHPSSRDVISKLVLQLPLQKAIPYDCQAGSF